MKILGIESSCDETAASVLEIKNDKIKVLSNVISSQIKIHKKYGGVVPEVAARKHTEVIYDVINKSLSTSLFRKERLEGIDLIAVTYGPGLATSLRVGVIAAQSIAGLSNIPLVGVNHLEAHLLSVFLPKLEVSDSKGFGNNSKGMFPALGLIVSGGHTELVLVKDFGRYKLIGSTRDDAVGEAFDKVAKMLDLGYPGGPEISKMAEKWQKIKDKRLNIQYIKFPRPMINSKDFDFSFSGLKTAVLYEVRKISKNKLKEMTPQICYEFQQAVIDVLVKKTKRAVEKYQVNSVLIGGGVSANKLLRNKLRNNLCNNIYLPEMCYTGDNATMIAFAGYKKWERNKKNEVLKIKVDSNLQI